MKIFFYSFLFVLLFGCDNSISSKKIVCTIPPLHSICLFLLEGTNLSPYLLLEKPTSPHHLTLSPSQVKSLIGAEIIFWIGENYETSLVKVLDQKTSASFKDPLMRTKNLILHPTRQPGEITSHNHHHHSHGDQDPHIWLDVINMKILAQRMASILSHSFPSVEKRISENLSNLESKLDDLHKKLVSKKSAFSKNRLFLAHDGLQYFEKRYGVIVIGSLDLDHDLNLSVKSYQALLSQLKTINGLKLVTEPLLPTKPIESLSNTLKCPVISLDYLGYDLSMGKNQYFEMMDKLSKEFS